MGFSGQLAKSSGCLRIVGEMVTRVRGELRASNRIAENILGIGSWRWWMWTIFLIWKNRANSQTAKMVLFVENNCFDFAEMVLRGPHIPDSPAPAVFQSFSWTRGESPAPGSCASLELIWIWLGLYFLFSSPDSRYVINNHIMSINVIPVAKPRPKVDFTFSGNMSFGISRSSRRWRELT